MLFLTIDTGAIDKSNTLDIRKYLMKKWYSINKILKFIKKCFL